MASPYFSPPKKVEGQGNPNAKIAFIGEAPGDEEQRRGIPFVGQTGRILRDQIIRGAGFSESECFFDNVCQEWRPGSWNADFHELSFFATDLRRRLWDLPNLNCVVAVGSKALQVLSCFETYEDKNGRLKPLSILNWRGSIKKSRLTGHKFVPIIHPSFYLHNPNEHRYLHVSIFDVARAFEESKCSTLSLPQRTHHVIYNTDECLEILKKIKETKRWAFDVETSIRCLGFSPDPSLSYTLVIESILKPTLHSPAGLVEIKKALKLCFTHDHEIITQNGLFDMEDLEINYGVSPLSWHIHSDTMYKHGLLYPELPHSLGFLGSIYTRTPFYKDEGRRFKPGRDPERKFFEYNGKDCCVTLESDNEMETELESMDMRSYYYNNLMPLVPILHRMYKCGIQVDRKVLEGIKKQLRRQETITRIRLVQCIGFDPNPRSPIENETFLQTIGCPPSRIVRSPKTKKVKCDEKFLQRLKIDLGHPAIGLYLDLRNYLYLQSNFTRLKLDSNGRYHAIFKLGPKSGRLASSGEGRGPQLQNIPERGPVNIRTIFVPAKEKALIHADYSQADARVFAYFAQIKDLIAIYESSDPDSHSVICSFLMGIPRDQIVKGGLNDDKRQITKKACHAFDYGMRERRLVVECRAEGIDITETIAKKWREKYLARFPEIETHWLWVQEQLQKTRTLTDLMGRKYLFLGNFDEAMYREAYSRVPQGTVGGAITVAMERMNAKFDEIWGNDFSPDRPEILIQLHDSLEVECLEKDVEIVAPIMRNALNVVLKAHGKQFTIPADFAIALARRGESWGKMSKLTF